MAFLTLDTLKHKGACEGQIRLFEQAFGQSVEVTSALCLQYASVFSWDGAARLLLSATSLAEYERVTAPALAECRRVTAPAWAEYEQVRALASAECERAKAAAFARLYSGT